MKHYFVKATRVLTVVSALICLFAVMAFAADGNDATALVSYRASSGVDIVPKQGLDGKTYLFLPSETDLKSMVLTYDDARYTSLSLSAGGKTLNVESGKPFDLTALTSGTDERAVAVSAKSAQGDVTAQIIFMRSANIRALYVVSDDPVNFGRPYVDASKENEDASGTVYLVAADGTVDYSGEMKEIKGRGNSTFVSFDKKPYQIKLAKKAELVANAGAAKKWVLLANAADPTMIRNALALETAKQLGLEYTGLYDYVDLYFDGEYRGTYMLTEKVEVGSSRVDISDTDELNELLNAGTPAYEEPVVKTVTVASKGTKAAEVSDPGTCRYVDGLLEPELPENCTHHAYLMELDTIPRYSEELTGFVSDRGQGVVTKSPEYMTQQQGLYISEFWQEFEDAVFSENGYNTETKKYYYEYCDLESLVKCYAFNEIAKNFDYYKTSTFFYLPSDSDIMYCGPVWDYDLAFGQYKNQDKSNDVSSSKYFYSTQWYLGTGLIKIESFRNEVKKLLGDGGEVNRIICAAVADGSFVDQQAARLQASQQMNCKIWDITNQHFFNGMVPKGTTIDSCVKTLKSFTTDRAAWLAGQVKDWNGSDYTILTSRHEEQMQTSPFYRIMYTILNFFSRILDFFSKLFN